MERQKRGYKVGIKSVDKAKSEKEKCKQTPERRHCIDVNGNLRALAVAMQRVRLQRRKISPFCLRFTKVQYSFFYFSSDFMFV